MPRKITTDYTDFADEERRFSFPSVSISVIRGSNLLSPALRSQWNAAKKTGAKLRPGRPRKDPAKKSLIVPISIEPALLEAIDKFAKSVGVTRSRLVAEGLRMRLKA